MMLQVTRRILILPLAASYVLKLLEPCIGWEIFGVSAEKLQILSEDPGILKSSLLGKAAIWYQPQCFQTRRGNALRFLCSFFPPITGKQPWTGTLSHSSRGEDGLPLFQIAWRSVTTNQVLQVVEKGYILPFHSFPPHTPSSSSIPFRGTPGSSIRWGPVVILQREYREKRVRESDTSWLQRLRPFLSTLTLDQALHALEERGLIGITESSGCLFSHFNLPVTQAVSSLLHKGTNTTSSRFCHLASQQHQGCSRRSWW